MSNNDSLESDLFAAEIGGDVMQVDLHGLSSDAAIMEAEQLINQAFVVGERAARIIHGRGTGHLRVEIHRLLKEYQRKQIVSAFRDATQPGMLGGVTVFALHSRDKE